jgi:hypothetical protein
MVAAKAPRDDVSAGEMTTAELAGASADVADVCAGEMTAAELAGASR